jgi:hypothetical protein
MAALNTQTLNPKPRAHTTTPSPQSLTPQRHSQYADVESAMNTQFEMLLGSLPVGYRSDPFIIIYVVLTNLVMFFLVTRP